MTLIVLPSLGFATEENVAVDSLRSRLVEKGFENVSVLFGNGNVIVAYENRTYRHEIKALRKIVEMVLPMAKKGLDIILIPQIRGIPLVAITICADKYPSVLELRPPYEESELVADISSQALKKVEPNSREVDSVWGVFRAFSHSKPSGEELTSYVDVSLDVDSVLRGARALEKLDQENSDLAPPNTRKEFLDMRAGATLFPFSLKPSPKAYLGDPGTGFFSFKMDIVFHPQFNAQFGDHSEPLRSQINLAPEVSATLWKGMLLSGQLIIPIQNEFGEEEDNLRPGRLTVSQAFRFPLNTFVSATMGYFTESRYGADLDIRKCFANGKWSIGTNVGYTGYASYLEGVWYRSNIGYLTAFLDVERRIPSIDLSLSATYGRFLYKDRGWRFDVFRQFDEVDIGFFAIKTEAGYNGGFSLSIPIPPSRYLSLGPIRIRPGKRFSSEYRYKGLPRIGVQYNTGSSITDECRRGFSPDYIKNQIAEFTDL